MDDDYVVLGFNSGCFVWTPGQLRVSGRIDTESIAGTTMDMDQRDGDCKADGNLRSDVTSKLSERQDDDTHFHEPEILYEGQHPVRLWAPGDSISMGHCYQDYILVEDDGRSLSPKGSLKSFS